MQNVSLEPVEPPRFNRPYQSYSVATPRGFAHRASSARMFHKLALGLLCSIVMVSVETFNTTLSGISDNEAIQQSSDLRQQIVASGLWILLMGVSFVPGVARFTQTRHGLFWPLLLLAWIVASPIWSSEPASGAPKAIVFLALSLAACRLTSVVTVSEMFACVYYSLAVMLLASALLALCVPSVGLLVNDWQHEGQWKGLFGTKQGLGAVSAVFLVLALLQVSRRRSRWDIAAAAVGLACLLGSGSRGAGVMAGVAVASLIFARKSPRVATYATTVVLLILALGIVEIVYIASTGRDSIDLFGLDINLTERTYIWHYALELWTSRPYLGYGLNGFWTDPDIASGFIRLHGWLLDNYHSGYLAVVVETGAVGISLFCIVAVLIIARLRALLMQTVADRLSLEMTLGFLLMFFTINLTETYFLRSTNFFSVLFTFLLVKILTAPRPSPAPLTDRRDRARGVKPRRPTVAGRGPGWRPAG